MEMNIRAEVDLITLEASKQGRQEEIQKLMDRAMTSCKHDDTTLMLCLVSIKAELGLIKLHSY